MSLFSGISNALKSAGSAIANYIAPQPKPFSNQQAPFLATGTTQPTPKTTATAQQFTGGSNLQSSYNPTLGPTRTNYNQYLSGTSGRQYGPLRSDYIQNPDFLVSGNNFLPSPNQLTTSGGSYTLTQSSPYNAQGFYQPQAATTAAGGTSSGQFIGSSPLNGSTGISGGQGLLPGSVGATSRGGFGLNPGSISGTSLAGLNVEKQKNGLTDNQNFLKNAFGGINYNGFVPKVPAYQPSSQIKSPTIQATDIMKSQGAITDIRPGLDANTLQQNLSQTAASNYLSTAQINNPQGPSFIQAPIGTGAAPSGIPQFVRFAGSPNIFDTATGQYVSDPSQVTSQVADVASPRPGVQNANDYATLNNQPLSQQEMAQLGLGQQSTDKTLETPTTPQNQFNLQEQYNQLQKASGITDAIAQLKDIESQSSAIEQALIAQKDAVMSDPDFSLATKEGRINYIFKDSMEARTYEALTARAKVLGDFIDKQNSQIQTQLGFANQDFQNQLAYDNAHKVASGEGDIKEVGGNVYVYNNSTGKWENRGSAADASTSMSEQDKYKLMNQQGWKQNYDVVHSQLGMIDNSLVPYGATKSGIDMTVNDINAIDWNQVANDGSGSLNTLVSAAYRMKRPDLTRISIDGSITDSGSLVGMISDEIARLSQDRDGAPGKIKALFTDALRNYQVYKGEYDNGLRDFNARFNNPLGLDLPKVDGGDTASPTAMRTDRHNNPTAFTTDIAKLAGLREGVDYTVGDSFSNGQYHTATLLGDPIATTIKVIDRIGFQTAGGSPRWAYINMPKSQWNSLSYEQKKNVIGQMYQHEGGRSLAGLFNSNVA